MSRIQNIETNLTSINDAAFQELCDRLIYFKYKNPSAFARIGSVTGKQKTKKGTPDSFLLMSDGEYIFTEITTNISDKDKLLKDIIACFDYKKTNISSDKVKEINLFFNFKIDNAYIEKLKSVATSFNPKTEIIFWSLDLLTSELSTNHHDLVSDYLGLSYDTGQIVSIEKFISEYNRSSHGIATPLDNEFVQRRQEMDELKRKIAEKDFIIVTGAAGVGKTKLVLESIREFIQENKTYKSYCISYKYDSILNDIYQYVSDGDDYILFADDANRIDHFNQLIAYYQSKQFGKLKILITVRDYAYSDLYLNCPAELTEVIKLKKLSDNQLIDIVKGEPFGITNPNYQDVITRISDGNPRLAVMLSRLAVEKKDISVLSDVSNLFETYFNTFIKDQKELANPINIKSLGVISFFNAINIRNKERLLEILKNFNIPYEDFLEAVQKLNCFEIVEINYDYVKISEQNLSTFFFYLAFIKNKQLSFGTLLTHYYTDYMSRFSDCIIPANNTFGSEKVMDVVLPDLKKHFDTIYDDSEKSYKFLSVFWFYLRSETLEYLYNEINTYSEHESINTKRMILEKKSTLSGKDQTLELLGKFYVGCPELKDAIELSFEYIEKCPFLTHKLISQFKELINFEAKDQHNNFRRQTILLKTLIDKIEKGSCSCLQVFYGIAKLFLKFKFQYVNGYKDRTIHFHTYTIPLSKKIKDIRKMIWDTLDLYFLENQDECFQVLKDYSAVGGEISKEILEYDLLFIFNIIDNHLKNEFFEHCLYVQKLIRWLQRHNIQSSKFERYRNDFINPMYDLFTKVNMYGYGHKEDYEFDDYGEFLRLKELEIRSAYIFKDQADMDSFHSMFTDIVNVHKPETIHLESLDFILEENFKRDYNIGFKFLELLAKRNDKLLFIPTRSLKQILVIEENVCLVWELIERISFRNKPLWKISFFTEIDSALIKNEHIDMILEIFREIENLKFMSLDWVERYLNFDYELYDKILTIVTERNRELNVKISLQIHYFEKTFKMLSKNMPLIQEAYLQQVKIDSHFDYNKNGLFRIIEMNPGFLKDYFDYFYFSDDIEFTERKADWGFIWEIEGMEPVFSEIFKRITEKNVFSGFSSHFLNNFFSNLKEDKKAKANEFLFELLKANYKDIRIVNLIVNIARYARKEIYENILLLYISLNQDPDVFGKIWWRGNGGEYNGGDISGEIEANDWKKILSIIERSEHGTNLIPIKKVIKDRIYSCLRFAESEKTNLFLDR
ncbi:hypothetical protein [Leptospira interrogans]|uniref:Uncharacterized protein n=2 Tax=Leptospira interrogans TaxID=173 RepID=A0A0F6IJQ1_LEPIR|nr:hypothetical protein [Leptospira interrogans]EKR82709.1 hypothetical protein LEP1GSC099_4840 [Leptospira interrogans str. UI 08452]EMJ38276.1 hypothetical protein LEP1GSC079_1270 [Leptospira interrogans str. FPW1039]EMN33251.1 hypothetical protein LEP1GSC084_0721 [Leptospira interrogans serovar Medanensis str. L0448]EMN38418.1 hypothetical protein LEP1GSC085_3410 [Leptospira interrogans str. L0996]EMN92670.1 hypothetical protein LEP1GSC110_0019 [Leptospira interrogans serovar Medanensis str